MAISKIEFQKQIGERDRVPIRKNFAHGKFIKDGPLRKRLNHNISLIDKFVINQDCIELLIVNFANEDGLRFLE